MKVNAKVKESIRKQDEFRKANPELVNKLNEASQELTYARTEYFTKGRTPALKEKMETAFKCWEDLDRKYQEEFKKFRA